MSEHRLKTWPHFFEMVWCGRKRFEVRKNDRNFQVGDTLILCEFNPQTQEYSGREADRQVADIIDLAPLYDAVVLVFVWHGDSTESTLRAQLTVAKKYQDIVYKVCNFLDVCLGNSASRGTGILAEETDIMVAMTRVFHATRSERDALDKRAEQAESRSRTDREVAENYLSHCEAACKQVDSLEAERDALLAQVADLRGALEDELRWYGDGPLCQDGLVKRCICVSCIRLRSNAALSATPAASLEAHDRRVRAEALREAANLIEKTTPWEPSYSYGAKEMNRGQYEGRMHAVEQVKEIAARLESAGGVGEQDDN